MSVLYQISSGQGPAECELAVAKFTVYLCKTYPNTQIIERSDGYYSGTFRSVKIETDANLSRFVGSILWVCKSPYRPTHGRKNWFLDFAPCERSEHTVFDESLIRFEAIHSRGKGGQNVNKVETGIRAYYPPTGDVVTCTSERTQYLNHQKAIEQLRKCIADRNLRNAASEKDHAWRRHTQIKRGSPVVTFEGTEFRLIES